MTAYAAWREGGDAGFIVCARGGDDLDFSKPRFIAAMLARFQKPILYLDSDMVARSPPQLIAQLCREGCDFAIYN